MKKYITVKDLDRWEACCRDEEEKYSDDNLKKLLNGKKRLTPIEVSKLKIPIKDRIWVLLQEEIIPEIKLHELACDFAEDALEAERKAGREPHPNSWKAIKVKRQWMQKKATDEELSSARSAAWSTAWSTARSAASSAAYSAARSAARSSASSTASSKQLKRIVRMIKEG